MKNVECAKACTKTYIGGNEESERKLLLLKKGMALNYQHHWIVGEIFSLNGNNIYTLV